MKKTCLLMLMLLILPFSYSISINEIMYNPVGDDNNKEFIEIIGTDNLSGYTIGDLASNDSLVLLKFVLGEFSLIVEEGFNYSGINCSVYSAGATIGNNLGNTGDTVFLYYKQMLVDSVKYNGSFANNNGYSLEFFNDSWLESCAIGGSPGNDNFVQTNIINETTNITINETEENDTQENNTGQNNTEQNSTQENNTGEESSDSNLKIEIIIPDDLFVGVSYDSLFRITNLNHGSSDESFATVIVNYNVTQDNVLIFEDSFNKTINYYSSSDTGRLFFEESGYYKLCGSILSTNLFVCKELEVINPLSIPCFVEINLSTDKMIYEEGEKVKISYALSNESFPYIVEYWVEDLFGRIEKENVNTSNTNTKTYTPKIEEDDQALWVKARLRFVGCDNSNGELEKETLIIVKKLEASIEEDEYEETDSNIKIEQVYDSEGLNFGDEFKVKLSIYRGDTDKSTINVFVRGKDDKKVSEETTFYLNKKKYEYNLTVKVLLNPNCDEKFSDGEHTLVVEGLDESTEEKITIQGNAKSACKATNQVAAAKATETKKTTALSSQGSSDRIISFYTRNQKFSESINLYANINASKNCELVLLSKDGENKIKPNSTGDNRFSVSPEPGINLYVLELRNNTKVLDTKTLLINLEAPEETTVVKKELLIGNEESHTSEENDSSALSITGSVVYESANAKAFKYAPYLLVLIVALVGVGLFISRKKQVMIDRKKTFRGIKQAIKRIFAPQRKI
ncbi:hypothetical protein JW756_02380 [Candidatus Woesearchaeota archaeon]|nr:hypothetical protein [Candidatus Woesearchaeota archaeon]